MRRRRGFALLTLVGLVLIATALAACGEDETADLPAPQDLPDETAVAYVYFATGRTLVEEPRLVDATRPYEAIVTELVEARPEINPDIAIVQPEAEVLGTSFEDGMFTIDWSREVLAFEATDEEKRIALAAFLRTMGQFPEVEQVQFTVEGETEGEIGGRDISEFWGHIGLAGQPWDVIRPQPREEGTETTEGPTETTVSTDTN